MDEVVESRGVGGAVGEVSVFWGVGFVGFDMVIECGFEEFADFGFVSERGGLGGGFSEDLVAEGVESMDLDVFEGDALF